MSRHAIKLKRVALVRLVAAVAAAGLCPAVPGADTATNSVDFRPRVTDSATATIYEKGSDQGAVLYKFKRQATRSGSTVNVLREYTYPDGKVALRERVVYAGDELVSLDLEELQIDARGSAKFSRDPATPGKRVASMEYATGVSSGGKPKTSKETLQDNTVIDDTLGEFIGSHWDALSEGRPVKLRYLSVPRRETVGFTLTRDSETTWQGRPALVIKMEATSFIIRALVDPVFFTVEKAGQHRTLQYAGRTAPKIKAGSKWHDLDAQVIYDWN
jgi:hypothetical protein